MSFHESAVEEAALQWFESIGYAVAYGPDLLPDGTAPERDETTVVLAGRLRSALERLDPGIPASAIDEAYKKLLHPEGSTLEAMNRSFAPPYGGRWHHRGVSGARTVRSVADSCARSTLMIWTPTTGSQ